MRALVVIGSVVAMTSLAEAKGKPRRPSAVGEIVAPVALQFTGRNADGDKPQRCRDTMRGFGAKFDDNAQIRIVIHLQTFKNHLRILNGGKLAFQEKLPIWAIPELCQEALSEAMKVARSAAAAPAAPPAP